MTYIMTQDLIPRAATNKYTTTEKRINKNTTTKNTPNKIENNTKTTKNTKLDDNLVDRKGCSTCRCPVRQKILEP